MPPIQTAVFDVGGVLIDWNPRYLYRTIGMISTQQQLSAGAGEAHTLVRADLRRVRRGRVPRESSRFAERKTDPLR